MVRAIFKFFDVGTDDYKIVECSLDEGTTEQDIVTIFNAIKNNSGSSGPADWNTLLNKPSTLSGYGITISTETDLTNRINALIALVTGILANLNTTAKNNLVAAINEVLARANLGLTNLGDITGLLTDNIADSVAAINELVGKIGSLPSLGTINTGNLVDAINEVNTLAIDALNSTQVTNLINGMKGQENGLVGLNNNALIDPIYLPSYVDDVVEVADYLSLPEVGASSKIYITVDNNAQFRWTGSDYINIVQSPGIIDWGTLDNIPIGLANFINLDPVLDSFLIGNGTGWTTIATEDVKENIVFGSFTRNTGLITTGVLDVNLTEVGTCMLAKSYRLLKLVTNVPARVRLYTTVAKRNADLSRPIGTLPGDNSGVVLEYITAAGLLDVDLCPLVDGFDGKAVPDGAIPYTITNLHTSSSVVDAQFTFIRTE